MNPAEETRRAARQSFIDRFGAAGRIRMVDAVGETVLIVTLATPAGVVTPTGVSITTTDYSQVMTTGDIAAAIGETSSGDTVATFTTGLSSDIPVPDIVLPDVRVFAGSFVRIGASSIDCY